MDDMTERSTPNAYRPSGRLGERTWLWWIAFMLLAAALGGLESFFYANEPIFAWIIATALAFWLGFFATFLVRKAHCRSPSAAVVLGIASGILLLGTGWWIDQYIDWRETDPRILPEYLAWRADTGRHLGFFDPAQEVGRDTGPHPSGLVIVLSWTLLIGGSAGALFLTTLLPWRTPRIAPYCETCGEWKNRDLFGLAPGSTSAVLRSIRLGGFADRIESRSTPYNPGWAGTVAAIYSCGAGRVCDGRESFVSVCETDGTPNFAGPFHASALFLSRLPLQLAALEPDELERLRPRLGSSHDGRAYLAESSIPAVLLPQDDESGASIPAIPSISETMIEPITDRSAGAVLSRTSVVLSVLAQLMPLAIIPAGLALLFWALDRDWPVTEAVLLIAIGGACLLGTACVLIPLVLVFRDPHFFEGLLPYLRAKASIGSRADTLVDVNDPEAFFVDVVPRANWGRSMAENAADIGFLKVEAARDRLLFEGDRQRYVIPGVKILGIEQTGLGHSLKVSGVETNLRRVVVLHVETADGMVEIPLVLRHSTLWNAMRWGLNGNSIRLLGTLDDLSLR